MSARVIFELKIRVASRYVVDMRILEVTPTSHYPDGIKFGLICVDPVTGNRVLLDNHKPKGPHIHVGDSEQPYQYSTPQQLVEDFRALVLAHMGIKI